MSVIPLNLGTIHVLEDPWPVHGFVVLHPTLGAVLIDTGCGGPDELLREYRVVNRTVAGALAERGLAPADVRMVINTHLHFDHCGQNAVFSHAPIYVQRSERERVAAEGGAVEAWLQNAGARFELVDGDVALAADLRIVATPGHTGGHQSVVLAGDDGGDLFVGDAAFRRSVWDAPDVAELAPGQAEDVDAWRTSLELLRSTAAARVHFCHDQ